MDQMDSLENKHSKKAAVSIQNFQGDRQILFPISNHFLFKNVYITRILKN